MGRGMRAGKVQKTKKQVKKTSNSKPRPMDPEEYNKLVMDVKFELAAEITDLVTYHHNIDMIAVMFALRDEFKFGRDRILRLIRRACEHSDRMNRDSADVDQMLDILKSETGITEEDMTWDTLVEV